MEVYHRPCDEVPPLWRREAPLALAVGRLSGGLLVPGELGCGVRWTRVSSAEPGSFLPLGVSPPLRAGGWSDNSEGLGDGKLLGAVGRVWEDPVGVGGDLTWGAWAGVGEPRPSVVWAWETGFLCFLHPFGSPWAAAARWLWSWELSPGTARGSAL